MAAGAQPLDRLQQPVDLARHERGGRLVEHEDLVASDQRARDLHDLLLRDGELADQAIGRQIDAELLVQHRAAVAPHPADVERQQAGEPRRAAERRRAREEQRLGDRKRRGQQAFLMDEADAGGPLASGAGRRGGERRQRRAADRDLAFVRRVETREHLDERRFARAVLADQPVHGAARHRERRAAQRGDAVEALDDAPHVERERRAGVPLRACGARVGRGCRRGGYSGYGGYVGKRRRHRRATSASADACPSVRGAPPALSLVTSTDGTNVYAGSDRSPAR
ncbi:ABC transporter, carbohydrate uptake transporter-2 (CUT2) family, ATP-binding domain protein [Burkholderia sp. ABCPW 111]|nr:ABC transporter, carbohydrate uptake transporter-2 (CUT2) family, ATP-binding domain protein [Burkholderia sp. ABCPW 111]